MSIECEHDCIGPSAEKGSNSTDGCQCLLDTDFQWFASVDHGLGQSDGFEAGFHFQVELEVSISGGMRTQGGLILQTLSGDFFRADALEDAPTLVQGNGSVHDVVDLIASGEWTAIQKEHV